MRRTAFLTAVLLAALCSTAEAKLPAPRPPDPQALRSFGLQVQWPAAGTTRVAPGYPIALQVTGVGRANRPRRVPLISLVRVDPTGRKGKVIARRRIAAGQTFRITMPGGPPNSLYQLRLDVGSRHYWSWLALGAAGDPPTAACDLSSDRPAATLSVSPTSARTAAVLRVRLRNTGTACLTFGGFRPPLIWQRRQGDGTFQTVPSEPPGLATPLIASVLSPGVTSEWSWTLWTGMAPGTYRILSLAGTQSTFTILP
jgi:hypothetical protein